MFSGFTSEIEILEIRPEIAMKSLQIKLTAGKRFGVKVNHRRFSHRDLGLLVHQASSNKKH